MRMVAKAVCPTKVSAPGRLLRAVLLISGLWAGTGFAQINASETGLHDANSVYGIDGSEYSTPWTNSQIISLLGWGETDPNLYTNVSFSAYGIYSFASLTNLAAIDVNAVGGSALGVQADVVASVRAYGIFAETDGPADVNNSGNITVTALGGAATGSPSNVEGNAWGYGVYASGDITNSGAINVAATGGGAEVSGDFAVASAYATVYGLQAGQAATNSGDITATATGGTANSGSAMTSVPSTQAYAEAFGIQGSLGVENSGDLNVSATGGTVTASDGTVNAHAEAYGIYNTFGEVNNSGNITVTATGGTINLLGGGMVANAAASASGIQTFSDVVNSGNITVTATDQPVYASQAYGIYMGGEGNANLTNTGIIRAFGDTAYELYVSSSTITIVDTYNITLDGDPERPSIFIDNSGVLDLNDATLTVTDVPGDTLWDTEYRLFGVAGEGIVQGNFGSVEAVNPDVTAIYYAHDTADAADDTVALAYTPEAAETFASASVEKRMVAQAPYAINRHMTLGLMYDMLAPDERGGESDDGSTQEEGMGLTACQRAGGAFLAPHYSYIKKDNDPLGYDAGLTGVSGGYTQCVNNSLLGLHVGYGKANIDYTGAGYNANTEDMGIVTSGFSGLTRWRPWIVRYGFSGFHGWHDYSGLTGLGLTEQETASYNSYGGTGLVMVGRTFRRKAHVFLPEIGANWLWLRRESYTTEATDAAWNTTFSTLDDHDVWGEAALHWQSLYQYKKIQITPSASIGIHQLLTDGETEAWQSIPGAAPVRVQDQQDRTALALASAVVLRSRRTALTLAYDGEYSSDIEQHNFWMKFKLRF